MDITEIKELVAIFKESSLSEMSVKTKSYEIKLKKDPLKTGNPLVNESSLEDTPKEVKDVEAKKEDVYFKSPMVGMFYLSTTQGAKPYVKEGDVVKKGQPLGVIEAMKMMNEITCAQDMKILEILVGEEQKVEYDQPLFRVAFIE